MADTKITALTALTGADPANDVIPIVDVSDTTMAASGTTKKISVNNILGASGTATLASATITGAASAAGLSVTGSTIPTNGVYLPSANNLGFAYNSTLGMTLNSTGLGVGVSPAVNVDIASASSTQIRVKMTGQADVRMISETGLGVAGTFSSHNLAIRTNSTTGIVMDTSQRIGIGVTPNSWESGAKVIQLSTSGAGGTAGNTASLWCRGDTMRLINGAYFDGTNYIYSATGTSVATFGIIGNQFQWSTAGSGTAGSNVSAFTQAMTLDSSGRLILLASTTTPATLGTNGQLTFTATSDTNLRFSYRGSDGVTRVANITLA